MSLINDALKRAGQRPASAPSAAGLQPTEERPRGFPVLTLFIVLIPLIALGVWFLVKGLQMTERTEVLAEPVVHARPVEIPVRPPAPTNPPVAIPAPPPAAVYKLQGIYWRPSKPSAVINAKTVYIGDRVETARVTAINQESVTLTVDGQSKVLLLP